MCKIGKNENAYNVYYKHRQFGIIRHTGGAGWYITFADSDPSALYEL